MQVDLISAGTAKLLEEFIKVLNPDAHVIQTRECEVRPPNHDTDYAHRSCTADWHGHSAPGGGLAVPQLSFSLHRSA